MSKEETVEVTIKVPKSVLKALREFILKYDNVTEEEYWRREIPGWIMADIDCICSGPMHIIKQYGLEKYYHDC